MNNKILCLLACLLSTRPLRISTDRADKKDRQAWRKIHNLLGVGNQELPLRYCPDDCRPVA